MKARRAGVEVHALERPKPVARSNRVDEVRLSRDVGDAVRGAETGVRPGFDELACLALRFRDLVSQLRKLEINFERAPGETQLEP